MIYFLICTRPFDQIIGSSFIYYFFSARPFDQKLGSSLIYIFHLHTTIRQKYMTFFLSFILSLCTTIRPKLGVTLTLKFILFFIVPIFCLQYYFIFRPLQSYPYISYTIFIGELLLYFVNYIHGSIKSYHKIVQ